jgi:tetratricopeptide (TPR) repeat protein
VVPAAEWEALAKDISASAADITRTSRQTSRSFRGLKSQSSTPAARYYRHAGDERRVKQLLAQLDAHPDDIDALLRLADMESRNHRFVQAEKNLLRALTISPLNQEWLMDLGAHYQAQGLYAQAWGTYQEVVYLNDGHPEARLAQAWIRDLQGDNQAAALIFREVEDRNGRTEVFYYYFSLHMSVIGEYREAITLAGEGLALFPDAARLYEARAKAYSALGLPGPAKTDLYNGLALAPNRVSALLLLGSFSEQEHQISTAIRSYGRILELEPGHPAASLGLGRTLLRDLRLADARTELTLHRKLHGVSDENSVLLAQAYYVSAIEAGQEGQFRQATTFQRRARNLAGSESAGWTIPALLWAGAAAMRHGQSRQAQTYYQQSIDMDPFNAMGHEGLSQTFRSLNEIAQADYHRLEAERLISARNRQYNRSGAPLP